MKSGISQDKFTERYNETIGVTRAKDNVVDTGHMITRHPSLTSDKSRHSQSIEIPKLMDLKLSNRFDIFKE